MNPTLHLTAQICFSYLPYQRRFRQPLQTHHGLWRERTGILVRLRDSDGRVGYGEIAPLAWFGSESLPQALRWCREHEGVFDPSLIEGIPLEMTATRFGLSCAWQDLQQDPVVLQDLDQRPRWPLCKLLGSPATALKTLADLLDWELWGAVKLKIGLADSDLEQSQVGEVLARLPDRIPMRLDANGGLTKVQVQQWLDSLDPNRIECLEQPMMAWPQMMDFNSRIPLALDESVAGLQSLLACYRGGWRGWVILKPAISGSWPEWQQCEAIGRLDCVMSGAFETLVGTYHALRLGRILELDQRAAGFGLEDWLPTDGGNPVDPFRVGLQVSRLQFAQVWQALAGVR